jgi:hypothetical protein
MFSLIFSRSFKSISLICFGILTSIFTSKFHFFPPIVFPNSFTLNFVPGFVFGGIFNFAFCHKKPSTSILQPKIKSNTGTSYVFSISADSSFGCSLFEDCLLEPNISEKSNPLEEYDEFFDHQKLENKSSKSIHPHVEEYEYPHPQNGFQEFPENPLEPKVS